MFFEVFLKQDSCVSSESDIMFYSFEFLSLDAAALSGSGLAKRSDGLFVLTRPKSGGKCQMQTNGTKMRFMLMYRTLNANSSAPNQPNWKL